MDYKNKYLKYKNKYNNLKKQYGGQDLSLPLPQEYPLESQSSIHSHSLLPLSYSLPPPPLPQKYPLESQSSIHSHSIPSPRISKLIANKKDIIPIFTSKEFKKLWCDQNAFNYNSPMAMISAWRTIINSYFSEKLAIALTPDIVEELHKFKHIEEGRNLLEVHIKKIMTHASQFITPSVVNVIKKLYDFDMYNFKQLTCTVDKFMDASFESKIKCINPQLVKGSCSYPGFFNSFNANDDCTSHINILNIIKDKLEKGKSIGIILGATKKFDAKYDINLYFNICTASVETPECNSYKETDVILTELLTDEPLKSNYRILNYFPLNTNSNHMDLLNLILELTNNYHIYLINKICGSCFRSFYYLTQHATKNFTYIVDPEQGLSSDDTPDIRKCFKD